MGVNSNLLSPFVFNYNLSVTHTFGSNLSLEVGYVGNHGYRLLNWFDSNQAALGAGWCLNALTAAQKADACNSVAGTPGVPLATSSPQATQEARPFFTKFPYLQFINQIGNNSHSKYDSLQVSLIKRMSHGVSFNAGNTYAHGFDNASLNRFGGLPQDSRNPNLEFGNSDTDMRHRLTFTGTYNIPGIKGFGQILEGWQINTIVTYQTAQPWIAYDQSGDNISGTGEGADRWNIFGNPLDFSVGKDSDPLCTGFTWTNNATNTNGAYNSSGVSCSIVTSNTLPQSFTPTAGQLSACVSHAFTPPATTPANSPLATLAVLPGGGGCYVSPNGKSFIVAPGLGQFGNMGRNILRDAAFRNVDFSVFKNFKFKDRYGVQFRWELFNALNHPSIVNPSDSSGWWNAGNNLGGGGFGAPASTPDTAAGNPLIGSGSARAMQLGLKLTF
jgi:hypothetical protein